MQRFLLSALVVLMAMCAPAQAQQVLPRASPGLMGALSLNTVPTARMDESGTARITLSTLDPYLHAVAGLQIAAPLHLAFRQSAEVSSVNGAADRLFPGIDLRLRLLKERAHTPEITLGLQSAVGHKRMAGEYLALSKRYEDFDITAGIGWGRLGSAAHMKNPLKGLGNHFGKPRSFDGEEPNHPENWFTGEDIGFFGGVAYAVPQVSGLTLKADWGADRFVAEKALWNFGAPDPWALGFSYAPAPWIAFGAALAGGEKLLAQLSLQAPVARWIGRSYKNKPPPPLYPQRSDSAGVPAALVLAATGDGTRLYEPRIDDRAASALLLLDPHAPSPLQFGRAARHMANHAGEGTEDLRIVPLSYGLQGSQIGLQRRDMEMAIARRQGSPQEIWRNAAFRPQSDGMGFLRDRFMPFDWHAFRFILDNEISLSEEDSGALYRTGLIFEETRKLSEHVWAGGSLRLDVADNLDNIRDFRPRTLLPVRSNVDDFAANRFSVERTYLSWMTTLKPDLHVIATAGMLEEMYGGFGGELLYRPFRRTFAIGVEAYQVFKRDPASFAELGFNGDRLLTGHLQAWYEFPDSDLTLQARIGRYLAEDVGGTLALHKTFESGARAQAFVTATNAADFDLFGGTTHLYSGLKFTLPLGSIKHIPQGSEIRIAAAPQGRDTGQALDAPLRLYDISEPLSYRHMARHWNRITE